MEGYSAQDVMNILDKARETGVRFVKFPGFEATWDVGVRPASPAGEKTAAKKSTKAEAKPMPDPHADYVPRVGKYLKGRPLREAKRDDVEWLVNHFRGVLDNELELGEPAAEFMEHAVPFLGRKRA